MPETQPCPRCGAPRPSDATAGLCPACLMREGFRGSASAETGPAGAGASAQGGFIAPEPAAIQPLFPQLEILELLGQGGMGAVYKARQPRLDRLVALKILPPAAGADLAFAERFAREARSLAKLNHSGIVGIHDFGQAGDLYYLIMEYVDGLDLRRLIHDRKLEPAEALRIVPQLCDALQYAHDEGVVHRDIKPENVLVDRKGRIKIADFGLAKLLDPSTPDAGLTGTRQVMGTWRYMAPEQVDHPRSVDHRADIYSLGVVFYELLTGELPIGRFEVPSRKAKVDARLDAVVLKTLENQPDRRYQHASEVKSDVDSIVAGPAPDRPRDDFEPDIGAGKAEPVAWRALVQTALAGDRNAQIQIRSFVAWFLRALGTVLLFAWVFHIIPGNLGLFLWLAVSSIGWSLPSFAARAAHGRLRAALSIRDPQVRDASLAQLALDAADEGDGETSLEAVSSLASQELREQIAARTARKLGEAGLAAFAYQAANLIKTPQTRDEVLRYLAHFQ